MQWVRKTVAPSAKGQTALMLIEKASGFYLFRAVAG